MSIPHPSSSLPPNASCPPSILIRGITPKSSSSSSSPDRNISSPFLEFSPALTTIPLHLWTNLPWVASPISALLGTPIQLARYPAAAAASTTGVNAKKPSPLSFASKAKSLTAGAEHDEQGVQHADETEEQAEEDGDFQTIAPLLPFFLEIDPEDVATFGKVRLNWLQGTVIVSSCTTLDPEISASTTTTTTTTTTITRPTGATTSSKHAADPAKQATEPASSSTQSPHHRHQHHQPPPPPLTPHLLAQLTQYLNGPVFRAIKSYRQLDLGSAERRLRAREIREEMFCPEAFGGWVLRGGSEDEGEG
ncbi:hypothetical protein KC320_g8308 [Hortaea werneckii]|nr:hypothetical protein KC320_g8308 [Hortaea werneckii]